MKNIFFPKYRKNSATESKFVLEPYVRLVVKYQVFPVLANIVRIYSHTECLEEGTDDLQFLQRVGERLSEIKVRECFRIFMILYAKILFFLLL